MTSIGGFDRTKELDELLDIIDLGSGVKSVATRQANALANLGMAPGSAALTFSNTGLKVNDTAGNNTTTIKQNSDEAGNRVANIPALGADDTFAMLGQNNAFTGRLTTTDAVASGTAKVIGGLAFSDVAASDDITAATSNNAFVAFAQTYSIPANTLKAGSMVRIEALVRNLLVTATVPTWTVEIRIGGTSLVATTAVAATAGTTNDSHHLEVTFVARAAPGAAVSCTAAGWWGTSVNSGATQAAGTTCLTPANFATNGALVVDVRAKSSTNAASNTVRLEMLNVEII